MLKLMACTCAHSCWGWPVCGQASRHVGTPSWHTAATRLMPWTGIKEVACCRCPCFSMTCSSVQGSTAKSGWPTFEAMHLRGHAPLLVITFRMVIQLIMVAGMRSDQLHMCEDLLLYI